MLPLGENWAPLVPLVAMRINDVTIPKECEQVANKCISTSVQVGQSRERPVMAVSSTGQCNTACSLSAGHSKPKVFQGRWLSRWPVEAGSVFNLTHEAADLANHR